MRDGWLPALVTWISTVAVWPTGTDPKFTELGEAVNWVTAGSPVPVRVTVAVVPLLPVMLNEPLDVTACCGAKMICTGMVWPGWMTVPTVGRYRALYGPAGGVTEVTVTGVSPPLTMLSTSGSVIPTGTLVITEPSPVTTTKDRLGWAAYSPVLMPSPMRGTVAGPAPVLVVNVTWAGAPPGAVGVNVTCACSASPLCRVTGNCTATGLPFPWVSVTWPTV